MGEELISNQVEGREGKLIQRFEERSSGIHDDLVIRFPHQRRNRSHRTLVDEGVQEVNEDNLAFPDDSEVELRILFKGFTGFCREMDAANHRDDVGKVVLHHFGNLRGGVNHDGHGGQTQDVRLILSDQRKNVLERGAFRMGIKHPDFVAVLACHRGQVQNANRGTG